MSLEDTAKLAREGFAGGRLRPIQGYIRGCALGVAYHTKFGRWPIGTFDAAELLGLSSAERQGITDGFDGIHYGEHTVVSQDYLNGYRLGAAIAEEFIK